MKQSILKGSDDGVIAYISKNLDLGLYPSSNVFSFKNDVSVTGSVSVFR
jgi:hypothetical protein